jgi:hypothetical protein
MREDISKILVTTPRVGSWRKNDEVLYRRREHITEDYDGPTQCSMRPKNPRGRWTERKMLNEYLNPLERYLAKQVGRRWDDVYSEICKNNPRGSAVGEHIFQHLFQYVRVKTTQVTREWMNWDYFVDEDGILSRSPPREPYWTGRTPPDSWRSTDDEHIWYVRRDDGCWFEWRLVSMPDRNTLAFWEFYDRKEPDGFEAGLPSEIGHRGVLRTLSRREKQNLSIK